MFLPINSSAGDFPHHGRGVAPLDSSARCGSSALLRSCFTVFTARSAWPLLAGL